MRFALRSRSFGVSGFPEGLVGSWPSSCFFRRASIQGVWILFSVKARKTPSVCFRNVVEKGRLLCCCRRRKQVEVNRFAILTCQSIEEATFCFFPLLLISFPSGKHPMLTRRGYLPFRGEIRTTPCSTPTSTSSLPLLTVYCVVSDYMTNHDRGYRPG